MKHLERRIRTPRRLPGTPVWRVWAAVLSFLVVLAVVSLLAAKLW